jgi:hypothetical protein
MTDSEPSREEFLAAARAQMQAHAQAHLLWRERHLARQLRVARWSLLPYVVGSVVLSAGIARVFQSGQHLTGAMLVVGALLTIGVQWGVAPLVRRRNRKDSIYETDAGSDR